MQELHYLKDCEINLENDDLLGTKCYADTILEIIKSSQTPFTVGLFGGWGSGKSSIIKTLKTKLNNDDKSEAEVFVYDAWKYSKDSFRRTFVLELKKQFKLDITEELETFYNDKNEEIKGKTGIDGKWWIYLILFLAPLLLINLVPKIEGKEFELSTFIISLFISLVIGFVSKTFVQYKISIHKPKMFAPEEFEKVFSEITDKILNKSRKIWVYIKNICGFSKKVKKLVIVIDNIDRCHKDLAFELLLTIKNFLEKEGVIFIIPIDEDEIKKHLIQSGYDANEFLRKLFNTTLNIKKFSENDLYSFAKLLNDKNELNLSENVLSLVSQEFSKNPRRIIQFLNVLQTEILFSKKQEECGNIPVGIISNNLEFLTKILLIREEWFDLYKILRNNPYSLQDISHALKEKIDIDIELDEEPLRFLERTRHIETKNPEAFFVNKDVFLDIPDELNKLVVSQDWDEIKKILDKEQVSFKQVMEFTDKRFNEDVINRGLIDITGFNIFSLLFKIASDEDYLEKFKEIYYTDSKNFGNIKSKLNCVSIGGMVNKFNPENLFDFIKIDLDKNQTLLNAVVMYFSSATMKHKDNYKLFKEYILSFADSPEHLKLVKDKFSETITAKPEYFDDFEHIFIKEEITDSLISKELLEQFINLLEVDYKTGDVEIKIKIIKQFEKMSIFSNDLIEVLIQKIVILLDSTTDNNLIEFWMKKLSGLVERTKNEHIHDVIFNMLNEKYKLLSGNYSANYTDDEYIDSLKSFLDISKELYLGNKASNRTELRTWFNHFFVKNDEQKIYLYINQVYKKFITHFTTWNWPFAQELIEKFNLLSEWEEETEIAGTLNMMIKRTEESEGLTVGQTKNIFFYYIEIFKTNTDDEINSTLFDWIKILVNNNITKKYIIELIEGYDFREKLNIIKIIKEVDRNLLEKSLVEIVSNFECSELVNVLDKLNNCKISKVKIRNAFKNVLGDVSKESDENRFKCFLKFLTKTELVDKTTTGLIINKIRPLIAGSSEDVMFSLKIIKKLKDIEDKKKKMLKTILDGLDGEDFDEENIKLLEDVKMMLKNKD
jgi:hypothetical protein